MILFLTRARDAYIVACSRGAVAWAHRRLQQPPQLNAWLPGYDTYRDYSGTTGHVLF